MKKHVSHVLAAARDKKPDNAPKSFTVHILPIDTSTGSNVGILVGGRIAFPGDLAEVTESEAAELILTRRAELLAN